MPRLRIVIVDDHPAVRYEWRRIVGAHGGMDVVAEAAEGQEALRCVRALQPSVVLMDVAMSGWNGIKTTQRIAEACPDVSVIAVSILGDPCIVRAMLDAGATGYVLKQNASD